MQTIVPILWYREWKVFLLFFTSCFAHHIFSPNMLPFLPRAVWVVLYVCIFLQTKEQLTQLWEEKEACLDFHVACKVVALGNRFQAGYRFFVGPQISSVNHSKSLGDRWVGREGSICLFLLQVQTHLKLGLCCICTHTAAHTCTRTHQLQKS